MQSLSLIRPLRAICSKQTIGVLAGLLCMAGASGQAQTYTEQPIYSFNNGTLGNSPIAGLIQASDGNFYGTTDEGGTTGCGGYGCGTVFKLTPGGSYTLLYTFKDNGDGAAPYAAPIQGSDGNFYGTTYGTTGTDAGSVYEITSTGTFILLHAFKNGTDGGFPQGSLLEGSDGNLYGTTSAGGILSDCNGAGCGTVFKVTGTGAFSTIYSFTGGTDGAVSVAGLVEGAPGDFYGTTTLGGANSEGTVFKVTSAGSVTPVYAFCSLASCTDGEAPSSTLWVGANGDLYGTTVGGGSNGSGSVFQLTTGGKLTTIGSFCTQYGCNDGSETNGIFLGSDGKYYGTTLFGGGNSQGSVFSVTTSGTVTSLIGFAGGTDAGHPYDAPLQGADGNFYGTSAGGGNNGYGSVWKMTSSPAIAGPVQLTLSSSSIALNSSVTLDWKVVNGFATTMQQCYASVQGGATTAGAWSGKQTGTAGSSGYSGSATLKPTAAGTFTYALTCGGIESGYATLTVTNGSKLNSATTLTATPNPATVGQTVTLKATVTGSGATPTGNVSFVVEGVTLGTSPLNGSGVATLAASSNGQIPSAYPITAEYAGSSSYNTSNSTPVTVTLNKAPTSTAIGANPTSVTPPGNVMLTATVTRTTGTGTPTGTVTFYYTNLALGTATLKGGVGSITASSSGIAAGNYGIVAKYSGDAEDAASNSTALSVTVK